MGSILFATWDGGGNVPPALALAAELASRGHSVHVVGHSRQSGAAEAAGLEFTAYSTMPPVGPKAEASLPAIINLFGDRDLGAQVAAAAEECGADTVVVDCLLWGVMDAMATRGIPYVVLEHLYDAFLRGPHLRGPIGLAMRLKGLNPRRLLDGARHCIVASLPELDPAGARATPPNLTHTGPFVAGEPSAPRTPTVLVSLSTFGYHGLASVWQHTLDAVADLPIRVVATTGPAIESSALTVGANTDLVEWAPHRELMPEVSLVIGHGGHSTTMLALAHSLPLLVMPVFKPVDQVMVGTSLQSSGAGILLKKSASKERIRRAVVDILSDPAYRGAAAELGTRIRRMAGLTRAADLLEPLLDGRGPEGSTN
ncbi:glycosyltransferase [Sinomonas gamaensis]|uniref:glycosyltransferase n=1 Tax=Sinomonas gamaensis TaxID=2565624 RepID=UPI00110926AA|nr:glycosyltransferase [Sinomonas gamaensis]